MCVGLCFKGYLCLPYNFFCRLVTSLNKTLKREISRTSTSEFNS